MKVGYVLEKMKEGKIVKVTLQAKRKYRIEVIKDTVLAAMKAGLTIDEEKLISECCMNFGTGRRTILEYLKDLENIKLIIRKDKKIWTLEAYTEDRANGDLVLELVEKQEEIKN